MSKVNWKILVIGLGVTLPLVMLLATGFGNDPKAVPDARTGDPAPHIALADLQGNTWSLEALSGTPVLVNFWSTWCGPCKYEHPMLLQAAEAYSGVQFLGVIYADEPKAVSRFMLKPPYKGLMDRLTSKDIDYPNLPDPSGRAAIDYGVGGVPESFFIDRAGQIVYKSTGPLSPEVARRELDRIMRK